jgi:hypothetical protein
MHINLRKNKKYALVVENTKLERVFYLHSKI